MKQLQDQQEKPKKYIQVKHVFISSASVIGTCLILLSIKTLPLTSEEADH